MVNKIRMMSVIEAMGKLKVEARKGPGEGSPLQLSEGTGSANNLILDFQPPKLRE